MPVSSSAFIKAYYISHFKPDFSIDKSSFKTQ